MFEDITTGVVCILDAYGRPAGTGFVVSDAGFIVTCAHVLGITMPEKVTLVFRATREQREARVIAEWWRSQDAEDVAVLQIDGNLPEAVRSLPLGSSGGTSGHKVSTFGFPEAGEVEGVHGVGEVAGTQSETRNGQRLLQLSSSEITTGFSGAPLWDEVRRRVIGMVVIIATTDSSGKLGETAFAIPTETLRTACTALQLSEVCPYRNLDTFTEADAAFFFGRQRVVDELVKSLRHEPRFLAVFGPSGSGKSSVVQAGLMPQLRQGKVLGSDRWTIILTRPTDSSFEQLLSLPDLSQHTQVAVVIDQFEELFVGCPEALRQNTVTKLTRLLEGSASITIIVVMRDDFYSRFVKQETLAQRLKRGLVNVPPKLRLDELVAIINEPAKVVGLKLENGLGERIVKDAMEATASHADEGRVTILPLLEFALTQLWERREEGMLTRKVYDDIGGVTGGLTQWADRAFHSLENQEKQRLARRIFTSLVYIGDENQGLHDSRRRMSLALLSRNEREIEEVHQVIQQLASGRLLVTGQEIQTKQEVVEIIHDALLWEWKQLRQWLVEDRSFLVWHQELERLAHRWMSQRGNDKLLRGRDLNEAKERLKERRADLNQDEIAFIRASATHRVWFVVNIIAIVLLLVSTTAVAGWYYSNQPPDPTHVTNLQDDGPGSLRWDISRAAAGSTITFDAGLKGPIVLTSGNLALTKSLTIRGPGAGRITISNGNSGHFVHVLPGVTITITGLSFRNSKTVVGFIYDDGTLTLTNSLVSGNSASSDGGGIFINDHSTLTLINSTVSGNTTAKAGGGIYNFDGTLTLLNSTISGNTAQLDGGGVYNFGMLTLINSTISGNTTSGNGGGITFFGSQATIAFCTIYGNIAHHGGGISIAYNTNRPSQVEMQDSIVAGNQANIGPDVSGKLASQGHNLIQGASGAVFVPNKQRLTDVSVDPHSYLGIDPILRDNGGMAAFHTYTHALLPGSPAIDRIPFVDCHFDGISTDQRGVTRTRGNGCDIGAYERT